MSAATDREIIELAAYAERAWHLELVRMCGRALAGDGEARRRCSRLVSSLRFPLSRERDSWNPGSSPAEREP